MLRSLGAGPSGRLRTRSIPPAPRKLQSARRYLTISVTHSASWAALHPKRGSRCECHAAAGDGPPPVLRTQIDKLLTLAEDLEAIDAQARRLSPTTLRQVVGIGG